MSTPREKHKQLIFDYCLGLTSEKETEQAEALIESGAAACELYRALKAGLSPLDSLDVEPCPDELAERTIRRLNEAADASRVRLEQLLADEQARTPTASESFWVRVGHRLATAAVFMIVGGIVIASWSAVTRYARQQSWQKACEAQLSQIFRGLTGYMSDYQGQMPIAARAAGTPWWKIGYQGKENYSNTRPVWLLVKGGYVEPDQFVCPGCPIAERSGIDKSRIAGLCDFPDRRHMTYSVRIFCDKSKVIGDRSRRILIADLSPLFEKLPRDFSGSLRLRLTEDLKRLNSINHNRRGQNVLFCDGRVDYMKDRRLEISGDDIFTLRDVEVYRGCEVPSCEEDHFLAP